MRADIRVSLFEFYRCFCWVVDVVVVGDVVVVVVDVVVVDDVVDDVDLLKVQPQRCSEDTHVIYTCIYINK